jgi:endonuclease G, mitochondrial
MQQQQSKTRWLIIGAILLALTAIVVGGFWWMNRPPAVDGAADRADNQSVAAVSLGTTPQANHLLLGNPSNATPDFVTNGNNFLIARPQYVISYNNSKRIPNWSSWQLSSAWLGTLPRQNNFRPDDSLPSNWYKVKPADYSGTGYDRGHMTPSADRDGNVADQSSTFFMTNILPQSPDNNQGPWAKLEEYCRDLVKKGKTLYIVAGGYGNKGAIGRGTQKIAVPETVWKVIVVFDQANATTSNVTNKTRVIAVDMPNEPGVRDTDWKAFRVSVDQIEAKTGYDFLSTIAAEVQKPIEAKVDK